MVQLKTANIGSYPRVGDRAEQQKLRRAISDFEQGDLSEEELKDVQFTVIREVIQEQESAGLDQVTDGQIRWYCPFSHMVRKMDGAEINGLVRYFDTNFYFRQPLIHASPGRNGSIVGPEFEVAKNAATRPVRQVLTGPFTLAKYSIPANGARSLSVGELARNYARALAEEINDLADRGARRVQLDEHGIRDARTSDEVDVLVESLDRIQQSVSDVRLAAAFSYGSPSEVIPVLNRLPVDEVVLDMVYEPETADVLLEQSHEKDLVLGVVNARNTKLEDPAKEAEKLAPVVENLNRDTLILSPSTGLELLPRDRAKDKLSVLVELKQNLKKQI